MRRLIPSFRTQLLFLVSFLVIISVLFLRYFFLDSFEEFSTNVESLGAERKINTLYQTYSATMNSEERDRFRKDVETVLETEWQRTRAGDVYKKEIALYSKFIFVFLVIAVLILFFITFSLISRPLNRLQSATEELSRGNLDIAIPESRFSPLNDLTVSFNKMTEELESNRRKLIQAEKESIWRDMARIMVHEIKNPLTPIRLSVERLETKYRSRSEDFGEAFDRATSVIHEEIGSLRSLVDDFSDFARLPEPRLSPYDLNSQLSELVVPYEEQARFSLDLSKDVALFPGDRAQMKQVFVNLIQNAVQASGKNCEIRISTAPEHNHVKVTIADNGSGISREDLGKIFDPYFSKREKGTGLGLAIVKRIVEQHEGTIEAESKLGTGTAMVLTFDHRALEKRAVA